jgi:high-affinity Fe2+/Pb2+ permease
MQTAIGFLLAIIFLALAGIHFYWGIGGKWGLDAALPKTANNINTLNPGIIGCILVGFALGSVVVFILIKSNIISFTLPSFIANYGLLALALVFFLRAIGDFKYAGFTKKVKTGKFAENDSKFYSPLCLLIGVLFLLLNRY